jgi:HAD superfamily hydrolase (TIGR01484 family)
MTLAPLDSADLSKIKLVATDIDGTLTKNQRFTPQLITALLQLQSANIAVLLVTGRSAGWVSSLSNYLPVAGAIGENGGCYFSGTTACQLLPNLKIKEISKHRDKLADCFWQLQGTHTQLKESTDNRFRLTDWTFDLTQLEASDLWEIGAQCERWGWNFTYSTIQGHIKLVTQSKATGIRQVLKQHFPKLKPHQILTVGDSPNDAAMFDPEMFTQSVGVANVLHYQEQMEHLPAYVTTLPEVGGFGEIVDRLVATAVAESDVINESGFDKIASYIERSLS